MPIVRRVRPTDLLSLNLCNLDSYTENYDLNFYLTYLMKWPSLFQCVEEDGGQIVAYIMGKLETSPQTHIATALSPALPWHGHITILTVSPTHRRHGYAKLLTSALEQACNASSAWFVDLYVRESNRAAIDMYRKMGYSVYRRVVRYYCDDLDAREEDEEEDEGEGAEVREEDREDGNGDEEGKKEGRGRQRGGAGEDAFDMRKPLDRDRDRRHVRENGEDFRVDPEDVY